MLVIPDGFGDANGARIEWVDAKPVYVLRPPDGRGPALLIERVELEEIAAGDRLAVHLTGETWFMTDAVRVAPKSILVRMGEESKRWSVKHQRRLFDGMYRVVGNAPRP